MAGFEPATARLRIECSTTEPHRHKQCVIIALIIRTMTNKNYRDSSTSQKFTPEQYTRLKTEAAAPYRGLRKFLYLAFGASGFIGAFIFALQVIAGKNVGNALPNLALQVGLVALMVFFWRLDRGKKNRV